MKINQVRPIADLKCRHRSSRLFSAKTLACGLGVLISGAVVGFAVAQDATSASKDIDIDLLKRDFSEIKPTLSSGESELEAKRKAILEKEAEILKTLKVEEAPRADSANRSTSTAKSGKAPAAISHSEPLKSDARPDNQMAIAVNSESSNAINKSSEVATVIVPTISLPNDKAIEVSASSSEKALVANAGIESRSNKTDTIAALETSDSAPEAKEVLKESKVVKVKTADSTQIALNVQKKANADLQEEVSKARARTAELISELEETRNRLLIAERQVEYLSELIQKRNAKTLGQLGTMQKPSNINRPSTPPSSLDNRMASLGSGTQAQPLGSGRKPTGDMQTAVVVADKAYLRSGPGKENSPFTSVSKGTRLVVESRMGDWYCVYGPDGNRAWVSSEVLQFVPVGVDPNAHSNLRIKPYDPSL